MGFVQCDTSCIESDGIHIHVSFSKEQIRIFDITKPSKFSTLFPSCSVFRVAHFEILKTVGLHTCDVKKLIKVIKPKNTKEIHGSISKSHVAFQTLS